MLASKFFISTQKEAPQDAELISHQLMMRAGLIKKLGSGLYTWMPLGLRVLRKVEAIVREEMNKVDALELLMPAVQPRELWEESGRWEVFGEQMLKIKDRHDREFCFGPTHEEVITDIVRNELNSYKQLPVTFYQIQTKFRDETRPRFGVMRAREFLMKDAYSFHSSKESLENTFYAMKTAYGRIFTRLGLNWRSVKADSGAIGGDGSIEFHVLADSGEDSLVYCENSDFAANIEVHPAVDGDPSPDGKGNLTLCRGIEVGHIFQLGDKYSQALNATFLTALGKTEPLIMGCYGIGISRIVGAAIEQFHDDKGIIFPQAIAPFDVIICPIGLHQNEDVYTKANKLYDDLKELGYDVLLDDRDLRPGVLFAESELMGIPHRFIVGGKNLVSGKVEYKERDRETGNLFDIDTAVAQFAQLNPLP